MEKHVTAPELILRAICGLVKCYQLSQPPVRPEILRFETDIFEAVEDLFQALEKLSISKAELPELLATLTAMEWPFELQDRAHQLRNSLESQLNKAEARTSGPVLTHEEVEALLAAISEAPDEGGEARAGRRGAALIQPPQSQRFLDPFELPVGLDSDVG